MPRNGCELAGLVLLCGVQAAFGGEAFTEPLIAKLNQGELSSVEQTLRRQVIDEPVNDNARFALALTQVVRAFERSSQFHYEYGARFGNAPFLLPSTFKENPDPNRISYLTWRRELQTMQHDLEAIERLLADIRDPQVKVIIPLGKLQWDLNGDGKPESWMPSNAAQLTPHFRTIAKENPDFTVAFDYADVLWFRGYCHLTMAALDFILSLDLQSLFDAFGEQLYKNPRVSDPPKADFIAPKIAEPDRWRQVRHHLVRVTELSLATWDVAERETDDDFEWLPNPKQTAAIRIQTTPEMIAAWRDAMREGQAVLEGRKLYRIPDWFGEKLPKDHGVNVRRYFDNPPERLQVLAWPRAVEPYVEKGELYNEAVFARLDEVFRGQTIQFSFWFN
jgi:hypothetical protein